MNNSSVILENISDFESYLRRQLRDESTISSYVSDARGYIESVGGQLVFSSDLLLVFINSMARRGLNGATIQRRSIGAIQFWRFAYKQGLTAQQPVTLVDLGVKLRRGSFRTIPLSPADFALLLNELTNALNEID